MKALINNQKLELKRTCSTINPNDPNFDFELWAKKVKEQMLSVVSKKN